MARWIKAWIAGPLCVALGAAPGLDSGGGIALAQSGASAAARRFIPGGPIRYVLGSLPNGRPVLGGAHQLLIPSAPGREPIDSANRPARLHPDLRGAYLLLDTTVRGGEAPTGPFASNWWPQLRNGIAERWNSGIKSYENLTSDPDNLAPTEKYDLLFYPGQRQHISETRSSRRAGTSRPEGARGPAYVAPAITVAGPATRWELQHHGVYQDVFPEHWYGHCNGWAAYVTAEPAAAPRRDVRVKFAGGAVTECASGEGGCILFRMADIEALMSELYFSDASTFAGSRCNVEPDKVERDRYGRPNPAECRDLNPGTMHVAMTGLLGDGATPLTSAGAKRRLPFVTDHRWDWEVWSFPVMKFAIEELVEVSSPEAMKLVCGGELRAGRCRTYQFNEGASRFARVKARYWMLASEVSAAALLTPPEQRQVRLADEELNYVLEMDGAGKILGGEWIKDPTVSGGVNGKKLHPDFLWMAVRPQGYGEDGDDLGGGSDNPFLAYSKVKALLWLSRSPARGAGR